MATKYYKSRIAGLSVVVGDPLPDEVAPQLVQFQQYRERYQGDEIKVGYLETDNEVAQKALSKDFNVEEIKKEDFEKATDPKDPQVKKG